MAIIKKFRIKSFKNIDSIIEFENISLAYGNRQILDNINFKINRSQIFGMPGPNGVGKSTIFNLITGLIRPKSDKIRITGEDATQGEIDFSDTKIIYLTNVRALIKLINSNNIEIKSDYGKYNTENFDTIFSQNVIINYLDNVITSEYLDFSIKRNSMIISRNVIYTNLENILKADVIEMNVQTKDTKIFMYKNNEKVNIKSKN